MKSYSIEGKEGVEMGEYIVSNEVGRWGVGDHRGRRGGRGGRGVCPCNWLAMILDCLSKSWTM